MGQKLRYHVGAHVLDVDGSGGRWMASVDGNRIDRTYPTLADAWTAGVSEAGRIDAASEAPAPARPGVAQHA
jgi:hypothetical protein